MMVTHNMQQAIELGNRRLMMDQGKVVVDIRGEEKKNLIRCHAGRYNNGSG